MTATLSVQPHPTPTASPRRSRRSDLALLVAFPIVWAATLFVHPVGDPEDAFAIVDDHLAAWMFVHVTMVACIPLMALAVRRLVRGLDSGAARISRAALPVFAVTYGVFETLMGLGTGILVASSDSISAGPRADMVQHFVDSRWLELFEITSSIAFGVAIVAAAFALQRVRAVGGWHVLLLLVAAPGIAIHAPPFGPVGLALFVAVAISFLRRRDARELGA